MLEKPNVSEELLQQCLRLNYDLTATAIEFLQLGHDSNGWVYRVVTDGATYFLKVKKPGTVTPASVQTPHYLRQCGLTQIVAPLETQAKTLWAGVENFHVLLYPFIEGTAGMTLGLTDDQWFDYGTILKSIHTAPVKPEIQTILPKEKFQSRWFAAVERLQQRVESKDFTNELEKELTEFWIEKQSVIDQVVARTQVLGRQLANTSAKFVICHADIHTANILIDNAGGLHVVDWDDPILAPKERDLMFIIGGTIGGVPLNAKQEELFFEGYGSNQYDPLILAYYRYEWALAEFGSWGESVFDPAVGAVTKQQALNYFKGQFAPGNVVDVANQLDATLN